MKSRYPDIELNFSEKLMINLFTPYDLIDAFGVRRFFISRPSGSEAYFAMFNAKNPFERLRAIYFGKKEKTKHLIYAKKKYGGIPERMSSIEKKTACGWLRLLIANFH